MQASSSLHLEYICYLQVHMLELGHINELSFTARLVIFPSCEL